MAEPWDKVNYLDSKHADYTCDTYDEAMQKAYSIDINEPTEYGVVYGILKKTGTPVKIK